MKDDANATPGQQVPGEVGGAETRSEGAASEPAGLQPPATQDAGDGTLDLAQEVEDIEASVAVATVVGRILAVFLSIDDKDVIDTATHDLMDGISMRVAKASVVTAVSMIADVMKVQDWDLPTLMEVVDDADR